jgi:hypothetical protein
MAGIERIAFLFVQRGANEVSRDVDRLSVSLQRLNDSAGGTALSNTATAFGAAINSMLASLARMGGAATSELFATGMIARFGTEVAKLGGHFIATQQQFQNTSSTLGVMASTYLPQLRTAMLGTVSDMDIMRLANFALASGLKISAQDFERLATASTKLALIHGRSAPESLERLTEGIVKQERRILDELGIILKAKDVFDEYAKSIGKTRDQLSAQERMQAFLNATLAAAETQTKSFTGVNFELASVGDRMGTAFSNFAQKLAAAFVAGGFAERVFTVIDHLLGNILDKLSQPGQAEAFFGGIVNGFTTLVSLANMLLNIMISIAPYLDKIIKAFAGFAAGTAVGNLIGTVAPLFGPTGAVIGQAASFLAPVIGAGVGAFSSSSDDTARSISDAITPRFKPTEDQVRDMTSILRNQLMQGAPSYAPVSP